MTDFLIWLGRVGAWISLLALASLLFSGYVRDAHPWLLNLQAVLVLVSMVILIVVGITR